MARKFREAAETGCSYVGFMLHSSELMPGGSATFRTEREIENFYHDLERHFAAAEGKFVGATLGRFYGNQYATERW